MSQPYAITLYWFRPGQLSASKDYSSRFLGVQGMTEGIGDASEFFAVKTGDVSITLDNSDGDVSNEFSAYGQRSIPFEIEIWRDAKLWFRGEILSEATEYDSDKLTATLTALGPIQKLARASIEVCKRGFPLYTLTDAVPEGSASIKISPTGGTGDNVLPLDLVTFADDGTQYEVAGFAVGAFYSTVTLKTPTTTDLPRGAVMKVETPFFRDKLMQDVLSRIFTSIGITDQDILIQGGYGSVFFTSPFQTSGLQSFGPMRAVAQASIGGLNKLRPTMSHDLDATETAIRQSDGVAAGFVSGVGSLLFPDENTDRGGYLHTSDFGPVFVPGGVPMGDPQNPPLWTNMFLGKMDHFQITQNGPRAIYTIFQRRYCGWPINPGSQTGVLFCLEVKQRQDGGFLDVGQIHPNGIIDWENGGRDGYVRLLKYTTTDKGVTWTLSGAFNGGLGYYQFGSFADPGQEPHQNNGTVIWCGADVGGDPERDFCISAAPDTGAGGTLYLTVMTAPGEDPQTRRISLTAGQAGVASDTTLAGNTGSCKALRVDGTADVWLLGKLLDPAVNGPNIVVARDHWNSGSSYTLTFQNSILGLGGQGVVFSEGRWNGRTGTDSLVCFPLNPNPLSQAGGRGWVIIRPMTNSIAWGNPTVKNSELTGPTDTVEERLAKYATGGNISASYPRIWNPENCSFWKTGAGDDLWFVHNGLSDYVVTKSVTGFVRYYDFASRSPLEAVSMMAMLTNSRWSIVTGGSPIYRAIFRPASQMPISTRVLEQFDGTLPQGNIILTRHLKESYEHSYGLVRVKNSKDEKDPKFVSVEAGNPAREQDALEITIPILESKGYGQTIATAIAQFTAGWLDVPTQNFASITGFSPGAITVTYRVQALDANKVPICNSQQAFAINVDPLGNVTVAWDRSAFGNAVYARIFRVSGALPPAQLGRLGTDRLWSDGNYTDFLPNIAAFPGEVPQDFYEKGLRQSGMIRVLDDGYRYRAGDEIVLNDLHHQQDPTDATKSVSWVIENMDMSEIELDEIELQAFQKVLFK